MRLQDRLEHKYQNDQARREQEAEEAQRRKVDELRNSMLKENQAQIEIK